MPNVSLIDGHIDEPKKITDKKLTDNDIIKALEDCLKNECDKCFLKDSETCQIDLMKLVLDLINRLQAENGIYETCNARKDEAIEHLEDEVKRLQVENETLKQLIEDKGGLILIKQAKAEAYKEFAEELHNKAMKPEDICDNFAVGCNNIDNLLKELVGDDNA